jgi:hypothetical protein
MKVAGRAFLFVGILGSIGSARAVADEHGLLPVVHVPRMSGKVQLDGRLSEPVWKQAAVCDRFLCLDGRGPARQPTEVRVFCDERALWFAFR